MRNEFELQQQIGDGLAYLLAFILFLIVAFGFVACGRGFAKPAAANEMESMESMEALELSR